MPVVTTDLNTFKRAVVLLLNHFFRHTLKTFGVYIRFCQYSPSNPVLNLKGLVYRQKLRKPVRVLLRHLEQLVPMIFPTRGKVKSRPTAVRALHGKDPVQAP